MYSTSSLPAGPHSHVFSCSCSRRYDWWPSGCRTPPPLADYTAGWRPSAGQRASGRGSVANTQLNYPQQSQHTTTLNSHNTLWEGICDQHTAKLPSTVTTHNYPQQPQHSLTTTCTTLNICTLFVNMCNVFIFYINKQIVICLQLGPYM